MVWMMGGTAPKSGLIRRHVQPWMSRPASSRRLAKSKEAWRDAMSSSASRTSIVTRRRFEWVIRSKRNVNSLMYLCMTSSVT